MPSGPGGHQGPCSTPPTPPDKGSSATASIPVGNSRVHCLLQATPAGGARAPSKLEPGTALDDRSWKDLLQSILHPTWRAYLGSMPTRSSRPISCSPSDIQQVALAWGQSQSRSGCGHLTASHMHSREFCASPDRVTPYPQRPIPEHRGCGCGLRAVPQGPFSLSRKILGLRSVRGSCVLPCAEDDDQT